MTRLYVRHRINLQSENVQTQQAHHRHDHTGQNHAHGHCHSRGFDAHIQKAAAENAADVRIQKNNSEGRRKIFSLFFISIEITLPLWYDFLK